MVDWDRDEKEFILFSWSGFDKKLLDIVKRNKNIRLVDREELELHFN